MPQIYESALCTVEGKILIDCGAIAIEFVDSDKEFPILGGRLVMQPSARRMRIAIGEMIPTKSPVFDWIEAYLNVDEVALGIVLLGRNKRLATRGYLTAPGLQVAVAQNASFKVGFIGTPANFE